MRMTRELEAGTEDEKIKRKKKKMGGTMTHMPYVRQVRTKGRKGFSIPSSIEIKKKQGGLNSVDANLHVTGLPLSTSKSNHQLRR